MAMQYPSSVNPAGYSASLGKPVRYWPAILETDPPTLDNACIGMITRIDDVATGTVRIGGFTPEGRPLNEGNQCVLVDAPAVGGWMPL